MTKFRSLTAQMSNQKFITFLLTMLTLVTLACNLTMLPRASQPTPVPVSSEAVDELIENVEGAVETAIATGMIQITFTEEQLTSLAAMELAASGETRVRDVQILLRNGLMHISGTAVQGGFQLPLSIDVRFYIDEHGKPHSQVVSAKAGIFSVPESMISELTTQLDQAIQDQINTYGENVYIHSIVIENGTMTITGEILS